MNLEKVAKAIEADAGLPLAELRAALKEAKVGIGRVTTPEQILLRRARATIGFLKQSSRRELQPRWRRLATGSKGALRRRAASCVCSDSSNCILSFPLN